MRSLFLLFLLLGLGAGEVSARPLTVGTVAWAAFSPLQVADQKGYWKEQGLEVSVLVFASNQEMNLALGEGRIDLALDMIGSWIGLYEQGYDILIVGEVDWSFGGDKIIAKRSFDPARLKGQRIGVYLDMPSVLFFLNRFLVSNHLSLQDVVLVEMEPKSLADSFIENRVPVIVEYDPQAARALKEGDGRVMATSATYPGIIPEGFAANRECWLQLGAEQKFRFWQGWLKAVAWTRDSANWQAYQQIMNQHTFPNDPDFTGEELEAMLAGTRLHLPTKLVERNCQGGGLERYLDEVRRFLESSGRLRRRYVAAELLDTLSFMEAVTREAK